MMYRFLLILLLLGIFMLPLCCFTEELHSPDDPPVEDSILSPTISIAITHDGSDFQQGQILRMSAVVQNANGISYTLQWQVLDDSGSWQDLPGETNPTLHLVMSEKVYHSFYRVVLTMEEDDQTAHDNILHD